MQYTLVIIDLQEIYRPAINEEQLVETAALIQQAREDGAPIVVVEHDVVVNDPLTKNIIPELERLIEGYHSLSRVKKPNYDGSQQVIDACKEMGYPSDTFRVCGVYSMCCVMETCQGLAKIMQDVSKIEIYRRACDNLPQQSDFSWVDLARGMHLLSGNVRMPLVV